MTAIVIPTVGRPSLRRILDALDPTRVEVIVVDDRPVPGPLDLPAGVRVLHSGGRGPAAARNAGWQSTDEEWIAFLDDDVVPGPGWLDALATDLAEATADPPSVTCDVSVTGDAAGGTVPGYAAGPGVIGAAAGPGVTGGTVSGGAAGAVRAGGVREAGGRRVGGVQGRVTVPLPADRRPTDWERGTAGLASARWITADIAYRREALKEVGGFDERFPRAYREDAELAYRVRAAGWQLVRGRRTVTHPVRPAGPWTSLRAQRGNADDALLRRLYGPGWRELLEIPPGRRRRHVVVTAAAAAALSCVALRRRRGAALAALVWTAGTAEFAWRRIAPGPRTPREVAAMVATSVLIPPVAVGHWTRGWWSTR